MEKARNLLEVFIRFQIRLSECEIIDALKNVTNQIIEQENELRQNLMKNHRIDLEDKIFRSYGVLSNCRKINSKEAMQLLSDLRLGIITGILETNGDVNIYKIMMDIQPGNLIKNMSKNVSADERDIQRAKYIRKCLENNI